MTIYIGTKNRFDIKEENRTMNGGTLYKIVAVCYILTLIGCIGWLIGFPIYSKIRHQNVFVGTNYALIMCVLALILNIFNFLLKVIGMCLK